MPGMRQGVAALTLVVGAFAGGCAASAEPELAPSGTPGPLGPLDQLLASAWSTIDAAMPDAAARVVAEAARQENAVAACMKEQGFEYVPHVPDPADVTVATTGIDRESREYAERYGFGVVDQPEVTAGEIGWSGTDPNYAAREAMSPAEREAYDTALGGPVTAREVDAQGNESVSRGGGCRDRSYDGGFAVVDEAGEFLAALPEDGAFDELDREWSACMRAAGFEYESPAAAYRAFSDELLAMLDDGTFAGDDRDDLAERESAAAVASWDCKAGTDYEVRYRVIRDGVQQAWIDAHRAELDAWLAATADR